MTGEIDWRQSRTSDDEALRFFLLYMQINEPEKRRALLDLARRYAADTAPPMIHKD